MIFVPKTIQTIIEACNGDSASIAKEVAAIQATDAAVRSMQKRKAEIMQKGEQETRAIDKDIAAVQAKCKHWEKTYMSDPSGGRDSSVVCDICGKDDL